MRVERSTSDQAFKDDRAAQTMLTAMLDQETGLRGFILTGENPFLQPYHDGIVRFDQAIGDFTSRNDPKIGKALDDQVRIAQGWRTLAESEIARVRRKGRASVSPGSASIRKKRMDAFRDANRRFQKLIDAHRAGSLRRATAIGVGLIAALSGGLAVFGLWLVRRKARAQAERRLEEEERRRAEDSRRQTQDEYRQSQDDFAEMMQVARNEEEAYELLHRHLERSLPSSTVVVLERNSSRNRLEAMTAVPDATTLAAKLSDAQPDACMAVRLGRTYERAPGEPEPLLGCELCGASGPGATCTPTLVGGEVIGSVLVLREGSLSEREGERIRDSVGRAAPVLANLRNLELARLRAATDALTGLPNTRSIQENLKRMLAHASRTLTTLAAIVMDLDKFKEINDLYGHSKGDEVLAAAGHALRATVRASDFVGRYGGEEFVVLMPDTDVENAAVAAEKIRKAVSELSIPEVGRAITASFGVAAYPDHAIDPETLFRAADRALYTAKAAGRNRVEAVETAPAEAARRSRTGSRRA